jgi:hypothetical protein
MIAAANHLSQNASSRLSRQGCGVRKGIGTSQVLHRWCTRWGNSSSSTSGVWTREPAKPHQTSTDEGCLEYVQYETCRAYCTNTPYRTLQLLGLREQGKQERRGGDQCAEVGTTRYDGCRLVADATSSGNFLQLLEHGSSRSARAQRFRVALGSWNVRDQSLSDDELRHGCTPSRWAAGFHHPCSGRSQHGRLAKEPSRATNP